MTEDTDIWPPPPSQKPPQRTEVCLTCGLKDIAETGSICPRCGSALSAGRGPAIAFTAGCTGLLLLIFGLILSYLLPLGSRSLLSDIPLLVMLAGFGLMALAGIAAISRILRR